MCEDRSKCERINDPWRNRNPGKTTRFGWFPMTWYQSIKRIGLAYALSHHYRNDQAWSARQSKGLQTREFKPENKPNKPGIPPTNTAYPARRMPVRCVYWRSTRNGGWWTTGGQALPVEPWSLLGSEIHDKSINFVKCSHYLRQLIIASKEHQKHFVKPGAKTVCCC